MIIGINLNHDYAYCIIEKDNIHLREIERISRIRHHWNDSSYTLSLLDDFSIAELRKVKAIYINSPKIDDIKSKNGCLSSAKREYIFIGDFVKKSDEKGISYGKIIVEGLEIFAAIVSHYHAHAASTFFVSPYEKADILCLDGGGDFGYGGWFTGHNNSIKLVNRYLDNQLGLSYHFFSHKVYNSNNGFFESKVMAIASYGIKELSKKQYLNNDTSLNISLSDTKISVHDIAQFQFQFEQGVLKLIQNEKKQNQYLCCAGGCFLNVSLNRLIAESNIYKGVFIPPYTADMGTAIGCAIYACIDLKIKLPSKKILETAFLGDNISVSAIELQEIIMNSGDEVINLL